MCVCVCWERFSLAGLDLVLLFVTVVVVDVIVFVVAFFLLLLLLLFNRNNRRVAHLEQRQLLLQAPQRSWNPWRQDHPVWDSY